MDVQTKLISHAIRIAACNTATALARDVRIHTGYAPANHEGHTLILQALTGSGDIDIDPDNGTLTVRLEPLPTQRATTAITQLCEQSTATNTRYPGTDLILRYQVKSRPPHEISLHVQTPGVRGVPSEERLRLQDEVADHQPLAQHVAQLVDTNR